MSETPSELLTLSPQPSVLRQRFDALLSARRQNLTPRLFRQWLTGLCLALPAVAAPPAAADVAALIDRLPGCPDMAVSTPNKYLDFSPITGVGAAQGLEISCARLPPAQYAPRAVDMKTPSGVQIGLGKGGQIYSIRAPGVAEDILPDQRADAFYVDEVFQTAATNLGIKRQSPRAKARAGEARDVPSWHYHQAGAYQRGPLKGRPTPFSPVVYNRIDELGGYYETLNIATQAHTRHPTYRPDRFLTFSRIRQVEADVFEITQAWISNSHVDDPVAGRPYTTLDHFNFPWLVTRQRATPFVAAGVDGGLTDLSDRSWPPGRGEALKGAAWFGGFASAAAGAPGYLVTLASDLRTRLRLGATAKRRVVVNSAETRDGFAYGEQAFFVIGAVRTDKVLAPGQAVIGRYYLLLGPRSRLQDLAPRYHAQSYVKLVDLKPRAAAGDLVGFCPAAGGRLRACPDEDRPGFWLTRVVCSTCAPVYELRDNQAPDRVIYSTDPHIGFTPGAPIDQSRYTPLRILGWMTPQGVGAPEGMELAQAPPDDGPDIRLHPKDVGGYFLFRRK